MDHKEIEMKQNPGYATLLEAHQRSRGNNKSPYYSEIDYYVNDGMGPPNQHLQLASRKRAATAPTNNNQSHLSAKHPVYATPGPPGPLQNDPISHSVQDLPQVQESSHNQDGEYYVNEGMGPTNHCQTLVKDVSHNSSREALLSD